MLQDVVFVLLQSGVIAVVVVVVVVTLWTPLPAAAEPIATAAKVQYQSILTAIIGLSSRQRCGVSTVFTLECERPAERVVSLIRPYK